MRIVLPLALSLLATTALSQTTAPANSPLAQFGLEKSIAQLAADPAHGFEAGMLMTLRAVEKTLQARYEYGLGDRLSGMPLLRLNTGKIRNPSPKASSPETLSVIINSFVDDISQARTTLKNADTAGIKPFEMALQDIWFDINANGTREDGEDAVAALGPVVLGARDYRKFSASAAEMPTLSVRFDAADHAWLSAYTNMLSGIGNLFLAFDPEPVLRDLANERAALADAPQIPNIYDPELVKAEISALTAEKEALDSRQKELTALVNPIRKEIRDLKNAKKSAIGDTQKDALQASIDLKQADLAPLQAERNTVLQSIRFLRNEIRSARFKLPDAPNPVRRTLADQQTAIDAIYVTIKALAQDPDASRIRAAHADLRAMIQHNRIFWDLLTKETDNDREWIPNSTQQSVVPFNIPPQLAEGWQKILADVEATLEGDLLIHHPLLPDGYGISLPAYVANPAPLDLIGWIHGIDAYKYAAKGPRLTGQSWQAFQRLTSGNGRGFALFLN